MRQLQLIAAGSLLLCLISAVSAQQRLTVQRCPAGSTGCTLENAGERIRERIDEGKQRVRDANNPISKGREAGRTVIDCARCGLDAVTSSGEGRSESNSIAR